MTELDRVLRELPDRVWFPPAPDLSGRVQATISARPTVRGPLRPLAAAAAALALAIAVTVVIPSARERVVGWLGIGGIDIETTRTTLVLPAGVTLGDPILLTDVAAAAGFEPVLPNALGDPSVAFIDGGGRLWILWPPTTDLPPTAADNIGAIVTQFRTDSSPGLTKGLQTGSATATIVDLDGGTAIWVEGPHDLYIPELAGLSIEGRSAGNTLIWEQDGLTIRLETALQLESALDIARSFR